MRGVCWRRCLQIGELQALHLGQPASAAHACGYCLAPAKRRPTVLPCRHSACFGCVRALADAARVSGSRGGRFKCMACAGECALDECFEVLPPAAAAAAAAATADDDADMTPATADA